MTFIVVIDRKGGIDMKHTSKVWVTRIIAAAALILLVVCAFYNWKLALLLALIYVLILAGLALLLIALAFNTNHSWSIPSIIHRNDLRHQTDKDLNEIEWIRQKGQNFSLSLPDQKSLEGTLIEHPDARGIVYVCHGYGDCTFESVHVPVVRFYNRGYSVFLPHSRGFSEQSGAWSSMGVWERDDHVRWISQIRRRFPDLDIYLYGISMGGAAVMSLADLETNGQIRAIVEDCGYVSLDQQLYHCMDFLCGLDPYPIYPVARWVARRIPGFDISAFDARKHLKNASVPILAFHGTEDDFVPYSNLEQVKKAAGPHLYRAITVRHAEHCQSFRKEPDLYFSEVLSFFERNASGRTQNEISSHFEQAQQEITFPQSTEQSSHTAKDDLSGEELPDQQSTDRPDDSKKRRKRRFGGNPLHLHGQTPVHA